MFHGGASGIVMVQRSTCGSHDLRVLGEARSRRSLGQRRGRLGGIVTALGRVDAEALLRGSHFYVMIEGIAWHGSPQIGRS